MTGSMTLSSKLPAAPAEGNGGVVAHDLSDDLAHRLGNDRVHLPGHDRRTGLQVRQVDLRKTASGT